MKRRFQGRRARFVAVLAAVVTAGVLAGGAVAFWTASGSGNADATVTSPDPVTLIAETPVEYLYPGTSADVAVKITNPNPFRVNIPSLVLDTGEGGGDGFDVDDGHPGCDESALTYTTQDNSGPGWFVLASADLSLDLEDAIEMGVSAANDCQGAEFKVYLAVGT